MSGHCGIVLLLFMFGCICDLYTAINCSNNPCRNEGQCIADRKNGYRCICLHGWTGTNCENNFNDCYRKPCHNGGQCIDEPNSRFRCNCRHDYIGHTCQFLNPCLRNPCLNKGLCEHLLTGEYVCKCLGNYEGKYCENKKIICRKRSKESRQMCSNKGECGYADDGKVFCKCSFGYSGSKCEKRSQSSLDLGCRSDYCQNGGSCTSEENGTPFCTCRQGFIGNRCDRRKHFGSIHVSKKSLTLEPTLNTKAPEIKEVCKYECKNIIGNGICDQLCNIDVCQYDGGDCDPWKLCSGRGFAHCRRAFHDNVCNPECNNADCLFDGQDCERSTCPNRESCSVVYQNGICDPLCNNPQCGFDGGDCHGKRSDSFFSEIDIDQKCSMNQKRFELDLVVLTTKTNFQNNKSRFLRALGSAIKSVLTISKITEITLNSTKVLSIELVLSPTECVIYGGQCFSSLGQISNFIKASIDGNGALSLPFQIARIDSKTTLSKKSHVNPYFIVFMTMTLTLTISLIAIVMLLRDKWGRLRTKVKTSGTWTPSEGYSTSTSSIGSNHKTGWSIKLQPHKIKLEHVLPAQYNYDSDIFKYDYLKHSRLERMNDAPPDVTSRKRRHNVADSNDISLSFQAISDNLQKKDGLYPAPPGQPKFLSLIKENVQMKIEQIKSDSEEPCFDIGSYVNDYGESVMHIASRMNGGPNVIKKLYAINPAMLHSSDQWGRTPLATAVASDAFESVEQLLMLEKQLRRETKQNKTRSDPHFIASGGTLYIDVKKTTGLIEAVKLNSQEMINVLLDEGSSINVVDCSGRSVVHWAAIFNNTPLLECLSNNKVFQKLVDLKDNEEKSPLYLAASEGCFESAKLIVEYMTKIGIKIDRIFPCPKAIALEMGFTEIESLISRAQLPTVYSKNPCKKIRLKDQTETKRLLALKKSTKGLAVIKEYKEFLEDSGKLSKHSPSGVESLNSCLFDEYSLEDSSINNLLDSYSNNKINSSTFKPNDKRGYSYLSNTSSSDMSPPLLTLKNPCTFNGCTSNPNQSHQAMENPFFLNSNEASVVKSEHSVVRNGFTSTETSPTEYEFKRCPSLSDYRHDPFDIVKLSSINR